MNEELRNLLEQVQDKALREQLESAIVANISEARSDGYGDGWSAGLGEEN